MTDTSATERRLASEREKALLTRIQELEAELARSKKNAPDQSATDPLSIFRALVLDSPLYDAAWIDLQSYLYGMFKRGKLDYPDVPRLSYDGAETDIAGSLRAVEEPHTHHSVILGSSYPLWSVLKTLEHDARWSISVFECILSWYAVSARLSTTGIVIIPSVLLECTPATVTAGNHMAAEDTIGATLDLLVPEPEFNPGPRTSNGGDVTVLIGYFTVDTKPYLIIMYPKERVVKVMGTVFNARERKKVSSFSLLRQSRFVIRTDVF